MASKAFWVRPPPDSGQFLLPQTPYDPLNRTLLALDLSGAVWPGTLFLGTPSPNSSPEASALSLYMISSGMLPDTPRPPEFGFGMDRVLS